MSMEMRIDYSKVAPEGIGILHKLDIYVRDCGLGPDLMELLKLRVSQINGCAYCINMHTQKARGQGESQQRLYGLSAWWKTTFYSEQERAALAWAATVTRVSESHVPDKAYEHARRYFTEKELVDLTLAVIAANIESRLIIAFRVLPESSIPDPTNI